MFLVANRRVQCYASKVEGRIRSSVAAVRSQKRAMGLRPTEIWFTKKQLERLAVIAKRMDVPREYVVRQLVDEALERRDMTSTDQPEN